MNGLAWRSLAVLLAGLAGRGTDGASLPASALAVRASAGWVEWWRSESAPTTWLGPHPALTNSLRLHRAAQGVEWGEVRLAGSGEAWRIRVVVVRLDPREVRFRLDTAYTEGYTAAAWSVDQAPSSALFAVNAGQFPRTMPWGWVALNGREYLSPRKGPLATGVAFDAGGGVRWIHGDRIEDPQIRQGVQWGFQSYPTLLRGREVPTELQAVGRGVDLVHRDARLAIGQDAAGMIIVAMTRFDGVGSMLDFVPLGLTVPEMAAVMGGLGAVDAVMLDGGISSQMLLRDGGRPRQWVGFRHVPLGLVALARPAMEPR